MPREIGTVVRVEGRAATVHFNRRSACERCGACGMLKNQGVMELTVNVPFEVEPGDRVALTMDDSYFLLSTLLLYGLPLAALVAGVVAGVMLGARLFPGRDPELVGAVTGIAAAAASYLALRLFGARFAALRRSRMSLEKVEPGTENDE